ncbi:Bypass of stop codon protein 6 [Pleurostoma richardsiae]|uniref:Bypass of stop codon protein 6 n=1 Tax=Pleurostoma richardsiae TaxID=41990 RepID=A0AA38VFF2_9PEZI|nr:Bypass of stop codon protein 6 [Pleurostoma richardsiae]
MDATLFRSLVTVESAPGNLENAGPTMPAKAVPRTYPAVPQRPVSIELDRIQRFATSPPTSGLTTPAEERSDLEMSGTATPSEPADGIEAMQSMWDPYMNRFRLLSVCLLNFLNGMNDSAAGALIPYIEKDYDIGYAIVSLIFVGNAIGFITAALFLDSLREHLGRAKSLALAELLMVGGYIPVVCSAPFPVIVVAYFFIGLGMSVTIAMGNVFCGSLHNGTTMLGAMHGSYGIGGIVGPLIATAIVTIGHASWARYYLITLGLAVINCGFAAYVFWGYEKDMSRQALISQPSLDRVSSPRARLAGMFTAFSSRVVLLGALFIFAYQGAEVSISGWVISFLINTRKGDPSSVGYVTSGFWAGITIGRFVLAAPAHRIGEKVFVYGLVIGATIFEILVWWVPNVIGDAISVAIVGLLLGPVYPCAAAVFMRTMSRSEQITGLGVISAFGSSGGAAAPFTTGILAQAVGTFVLHPVAIALFAVMLICWYGLPSDRKRNE